MELRPDNFIGLFIGGAALFALISLSLYPFHRVRIAALGFRFGIAQTWRKWHIYGGLAFLVLMLLHSGLRWPNDFLTGALYVCALLMTLTGVVWWWLETVLPRRLAALTAHSKDTEVLFERIPEAHAHVLTQGETLQADASEQLQNFYQTAWLPQTRWLKFSTAHFFHAPSDELARAAEAIKPVLHSEEHEAVDELHTLYLMKQRLEASYSLQLVLKRFHLAHGPLAFILLALALWHAASVLIF